MHPAYSILRESHTSQHYNREKANWKNVIYTDTVGTFTVLHGEYSVVLLVFMEY